MGYDAKRGEPIDKNPHVVIGKKKKSTWEFQMQMHKLKLFDDIQIFYFTLNQ